MLSKLGFIIIIITIIGGNPYLTHSLDQLDVLLDLFFELDAQLVSLLLDGLHGNVAGMLALSMLSAQLLLQHLCEDVILLSFSDNIFTYM